MEGGAGSAWNTQYIGLRLAGGGSDATGKSGIWIALRKQEIGIRKGDWPATSYMSLAKQGIDFRTERMLWVEDDMSTDTVTVSVENDSGERVAVAVVKVEGTTVSMYRPGEETPAITDTGVTVPASGYANIWLHHLNEGDSYITDGFPTSLCWADGKAWLELNESLIHEGEDLSSYDRMCSDFGIRDCESIEDFNALLEELGDDAVQSATLYPEESEEYNLC